MSFGIVWLALGQSYDSLSPPEIILKYMDKNNHYPTTIRQRIVNHVHIPWDALYMYRQISNISRTKSQNLIVSRLVLQLSMSNALKPDVKLRMKM